MLSRYSEGTYQGNELTRNWSGSTQPQSSDLAEPLLTDPGLKSGFGVRELICASKNKTNEKRKKKVSHSQNMLTALEVCVV